MADGEGTGEGTVTGAGTGQDAAPAWIAQLPENLKANEVFTKHKTIGDLGKAHLDVLGKIKELDGVSEKARGLETKLSNSVPKLGQNPTDAEKAAFYTAIGRPDAPDKYELPQPADGVTINEPLKKWFVDTAYGVGLTNSQAKVLFEGYNNVINGLLTSETESRKKETDAAMEKLKTDLGDKFKPSMEMASRFWKKVANSELEAFLNETGVGNHPTLIKFIINTAKLMGEDVSPPGTSGGSGRSKEGMIYNKSPAP